MSRKPAPMALVPAENMGELAYPAARPPQPAVRPRATLGDYLDSIYRRKWWIVGLMALAVALAYLITRRMPRLYESTATLDVERMTPSALVGPELSTQVAPDMDQLVATHMRMLQSDSVLRPVVDRYGLLTPEENSGVIRLPQLRISRPPGTYLIQVSYRAADAGMAANVANAIAQTYLRQIDTQRKVLWDQLAGATRKQLGELQARMEQSNHALLVFQQGIGMVDPEDKSNVLAARLIQLNTDVARAQSDRAAKEASYDTLVSGSPEAAEASLQGDQIKALIARKAEAQQKFADVRAIYGDRNAEYRRAQAQVDDIDAQLRVAYNKVVKRAEAELRETRLREANLKNAYQQSKGEADRVSARSVEYRLLRQRADSDRQIYDELARKVGEAEINAQLRSPGVRLADYANPDSRHASPSTLLNCALALIGSLLLGCAAAVAYDSKHVRIRTADDVRAACGVELVTLLPHVRAWRGNGDTLAAVAGTGANAGVELFREQIKRLRNAFDQALSNDLPRVIVVVSPSHGDGRSRVASEFGMAYAALGQRTVILDADLRNPMRRRTTAAGLSSVLAGEASWKDVIMSAEDAAAPDLLPAGPHDERVSELVHQGLDAVIGEIAHDYDLVIVDSPPFVRYSETLDIVRSADAVIVVTRANHTDPREFETTLRYLRRMNTRVGAVVLNDAD